eukprot:493265_1
MGNVSKTSKRGNEMIKFHYNGLNHVDKKSFYTVFGFIRSDDEFVVQDKTIPNIVYYICLLYYSGYITQCHFNRHGSSIQISGNNATLTVMYNGTLTLDNTPFNQWNSAYGNKKFNPICGKIIKYRIKINKCSRVRRNVMYIGISSNDNNVDTFLRNSNYYYAYGNYGSAICDKYSGVKVVKYHNDIGALYKTGDIVTLILDFANLNMSIQINDLPTIAFKNIKKSNFIDIRYTLVVSVRKTHSSVTIIDYAENNPKSNVNKPFRGI